MARLKDKVILVTGGARGLGEAEARRFAAEGALVAICDRLEKEGTETAADIVAAGGRARFFPLDVTDESAWDAAAAAVAAWGGGLHGLVNNAGVVNRTGTMGTTLAAWTQVLAVNLSGAFLGIRAVAPHMRAAGGGAVVNIASVAAYTGHNDPAYSTTKAGILGLTRSAAMEFVDWGIRVNAVSPGIIVTALNNGGAHLEPWRRATPLGRYGRMEEVANTVLFLLSDEAGFITGEDIAVDGGFKAGGAARRISLEAGIDLTAPGT
ncbi:SDR family NAD(P)-dependent oxidoreductase [Zavarzinia compransoris]|uniref:Cyclopentanol dehydrogenase n=1 Tax=Zavarzinia compransoris TaxID=1264899 RepID=A0A317E321_9PROT|nr:SDR family NAD(P)-dependent oxidoreductase [Zavarzinia compransoris]PWR20992.1 cyclopentanol dehydrogenase [Zavarzinia compransoris]TDP44024.1 NAD(P)-dependent dehydrogenase (short-subunit alcohol dehydrogenase family) [Zavarzinia compransoris]